MIAAFGVLIAACSFVQVVPEISSGHSLYEQKVYVFGVGMNAFGVLLSCLVFTIMSIALITKVDIYW